VWWWLIRCSGRQNLISLCFRPLRLCFPAESVRSARILVLKATHLPFVAIIWAYENSQQYVRNARRAPALLSSGGGAPTPAAAGGRKRYSALNGAQPLERQHYATLPDNNPRPPIAGSADSVADLMALIEKLSSQVDELTSIVTSQKE
jgi:hypothetical protein